MSKFRFKFENVKKVKEALETKTKKEIAQIDIEIEEDNNQKQKLIDEKKNALNKISRVSVKASELRFCKNYESLTEKKIQKIDEHMHKLGIRREIKIEELVEKKRETKILSKLEENMLDDFNKEQNKLDIKKFDEIATQKFVRQKK